MRGTAEMIFTGDELLRGDTLNTNQTYLGERLLDLGLFATHALSVTDDLQAIADALQQALLRRPEVIIISGGLGPTEDDLTREAVGAGLGRPLVEHEDLWEEIGTRFAMLNLPLSETNRKQALLPEGAIAIPLVGTAPGFWFVEGDTVVAALPGVPRELRQMYSDTLEPILRARLGGDALVGAPGLVRRLRLYGIGESSLAEALQELPWRSDGIDIGTRADTDGVTLILRARPGAGAQSLLDSVEAEAREILGIKVYGTGSDTLSAVVGRLLLARRFTLATAESCTGGLVAKKLTDVPGSSRTFVGGVVAYSNLLKMSLLDVPAALLERHGAVSEEVAAAMVEGVRSRLGADCAISITGIAGPDGATADKPVGLVYIGTMVGFQVQVRRFTLFRTRDEIRERAAQTSLDILRRRLLEESPTE